MSLVLFSVNVLSDTPPRRESSSNIPSTLVFRDTSGNFAASAITATAINPAADATYDMGVGANRWHDIFVSGSIRNGSDTEVSLTNGVLQTATGQTVDWVGRKLTNASDIMLDWSTVGTLNASTNKITNVVNPTSAQDAATKSYVDSSLTNLNAFVNGGNAFGSNATLGTTDSRSLSFLTNNSTKVIITSAGNVGIGTLTPATTFNVSAAQSAQAFFDNFGFASSIIGRRANGSMSAPTGVLLDEPILNLGARGYGATGFASASTGSYRIYAKENFTDSAQGTYATIHTTPAGSTTAAERVRVDSNGKVGIGTSTPLALLDARTATADPVSADTAISGTMAPTWGSNSTVGSIALQSIMTPSISSGSTTSGGIYSIFAQALVPSGSGSGNFNSLFGERIQYGMVTGSAGSVTAAYGLNIVPYHQSGTITNSYAIRISSPNTGGTVTNEYGLIQDSATAINYYVGKLGVGNTNPSARFQVSSSQSGTPATTAAYADFVGSSTFTDTNTASSGTAAYYAANRITGGTLAATNSTVTTTTATTLRMTLPVSGANETITSSKGLDILTANVAAGGGTVTNSYGIAVAASSGATNNYAGIFTGGNVGIATTSPVTRLEVDGTSSGGAGTSTPDGITIKDTSTGSVWDLVNPWSVIDFISGDASTKGIGVRYRIGPVMNNAAGGADHLGFFSAPTTAGTLVERMTISDTGNVGIGTVTPSQQLEIQAASANPATLLMSTDGLTTGGRTNLGFQTLGAGTAAPVLAGTKGWILSTRGDAYTVANQQNDMIFFKYNGTTTTVPLYIDYVTENIGIGTQLIQPTNRLDVNGAAAIGTSYAANATAPANGLVVQGSVGIGTATPLHTLDVYGDCISFNGTCLSANATAAITYVADNLKFGGIGTQLSALTRFIGAQGTAIATTDTTGILMPVAGTLQFAYAGADTNTVNGNTTFTIMKNSVASAFAVVMGSAATSANDTSSTLSVAAGDRISIRVVTAGSSGTLTRPMFSIALNATVNTTGGTVTSLIAGTGLTGGTITTTGTLAVDVGTIANKIVQLDGSAKIPAIDGSQVTNITPPQGTVCGWYDSVGIALIVSCKGSDPNSACPSGYTQKTTTGAKFCAAN